MDGGLVSNVSKYRKEYEELFSLIRKYPTKKVNDLAVGFYNIPQQDIDNIQRYCNTVKNGVRDVNAWTNSVESSGQTLAQTTRGVSRGQKMIRMLGSSIGNIAANLAISFAIQTAIDAWENYSNKQEIAIEKGEERLTEYQSELRKFSESSSLVDSVGDRFEELHKGISSTGENIGLTTDEYKEYQDIVSQLAESIPDLIDGYDSLGNPIISSVSNVRELTSALQEQQRIISQENINNAKEYAEAFNAVFNQEPTDFTQESGLIQQKQMLDAMVADINAGKNIAQKYFGDTEITTSIAGIAKPLHDLFFETGTFASSVFESFSGFEMPEFITRFGNLLTHTFSLATNPLKNAVKFGQGFFKSMDEGVGVVESLGLAFEHAFTPESMFTEDIEKNISDLLVAQDIAKEAGITDEGVLKKIRGGEELDHDTEQYVRDKVIAYQKQITQEMNQQFDNTKPLLESMLTGDDNNINYNNLRDSTKSAISQIVNGMDVDDAMDSGLISKEGNLNTDQFKVWADGVAKNLQSSRMQDTLSDLFSLKDKSGDLGYKEYMEETDSLVESISSKVPQLSENILKSATGIGDELEDLKQQRIDLMNDGFSETLLNELPDEDLEILWKLNIDGVINNVNEAKKAIEEYKRGLEESNPDKYYNAWKDATETENQGNKYDTMYSGFENVMDAYKKGLTGTDDFKSFAAMISPTGSDDPRNFAENYPKFQRYFTEGKEGINRFISDISGMVDSTGQAFATLNKETGQYDFNVSDLDALGQKLGISSEMVGAIFGKMREYGIDNNIITSAEEGATRTGELISDLQAERNRYNKLIEETPEGEQGYNTDAGSHTFGNQTAIDESRRKIQQYNEDIQETSANTQKLIDTQNDSAESRRSAAIAAAKALNEEKKAAEDAGMFDTANLIQGEMNKLGEKYNFNVDAEVNFDMDETEDDIDSLSEKAWNLAKNGKDASKTMNSMAEKISQVSEYGGDVSAMVEDFNALAEETGSVYRMDDLGNKFDVSEETKNVKELANEAGKLAKSGGDASGAMANMVDPIQKLAEAGVDVTDLVNTYNALAETTGSEFRMDMTGQITSVDPPKETPTIDVKSRITSSPEFPKTNETQMENLIGQFNNAYDEWSDANSGGALVNPMDMFTSRADMMNIATQISQQPVEVRAKFGIEGETPEEIISELTNGDYEIKVKSDTSEAEQGVKETTSEVENANPLLKMKPDTSDVESTTQKSLLDLAKEKTDIKMGADTSELESKTKKTLTDAIKGENDLKIGADTTEAEEKIKGTRKVVEKEVSEAQGDIIQGSGTLINADLSNASGISDLNSYLSSLEQGTTATVTVDVEGESDVENLISSMQNTPDATPVTFQCTVENQEQLDALAQEAETLNAQGKQITLEASVDEVDTSSIESGGEDISVPVTVKLDESQFSSLTQSLSGEPIEIPSKVEDPEMPNLETQNPISIPSEVEPPETPEVQGETVEYPSTVDNPEVPPAPKGAPVEYSSTVDDPVPPAPPNGEPVHYGSNVDAPIPPAPPSGGDVHYTSTVDPVSVQDEQANVDYQVNDPAPPEYPNQNPSVNYHLYAPPAPSYPNISRTITYTIHTIGSIPGKAAGTMLSPARVDGTAYNVINYKNAYSSGKVSLPKDETALVNELGKFLPLFIFEIENLSNAGNPLEPYIPQHSHEIRAGVMV